MPVRVQRGLFIGCVSINKIQDCIPKSERIRKQILRSFLLKRLLQDLSEHSAPKKPKNPLPE